MNLLHSNAIILQCVKQTNTGQKNALVHFYSRFSVSDYTGEVFITDTGLRESVLHSDFSSVCHKLVLLLNRWRFQEAVSERELVYRKEKALDAAREFIVLHFKKYVERYYSENNSIGMWRNGTAQTRLAAKHSVFSPGFALQINTSFSSLEDCTLARLCVPVTHDLSLSALRWKCTLRQKYKPGTFENNTAHGSQSEKKGRGHTPCFSLRFHHYSRNREEKKIIYLHTSWLQICCN